MHIGIANPRCREKRSRRSRHMSKLQFCVSGKRPIYARRVPRMPYHISLELLTTSKPYLRVDCLCLLRLSISLFITQMAMSIVLVVNMLQLIPINTNSDRNFTALYFYWPVCTTFHWPWISCGPLILQRQSSMNTLKINHTLINICFNSLCIRKFTCPFTYQGITKFCFLFQ